jgi:PAS domain S-box-containing protein
MNILVVDDDAIHRKLLRVTLEAQGQTITEAGDGVEALAILERGATDAVISDGLMPRMDGYRLCYQVRRNERFRNLPFVIYTSIFTSPSDEKSAVELGAGFIRKPASAEELLALLNESKPPQDSRPGTQIQELTVVKEYSERLVTKLEQKNADLIRTTEELRKAWDFHLTLLDNFPTPVWRSGLDAKCNYLNHAWFQFTGRKLEEDLGDGYTQVLHPDDVARVMQEYQAAFHARQPFCIQYRLRRFDGVYRNFLSYGRPYVGVDGNFAGYVGSCYDITESKRSQDRLETFAILGQRLNSATIVREAAQIISEVADHLLGWDAFVFDLYSAESGLTQPVLNIDFIGGRRTEVNQDAAPQQPTARTQRVLRDGGQIILRDVPVFEPGAVPFGDTARPSASIITVPVRSAERAVGILSIQSYSRNAYDRQALDTMQALAVYCGGALDRIRSATELFGSEERFRQLAVNIDKVFWLSDLHNTEMFYVNPAYQKIWGRTRQSLYAAPSSWLQAVHPEDQARVREAFKKRKESDTLDLTYRIVRPDGEVRWIHDHVFPVPNEDGEFYRRAGIAEDITEQKHVEDDMRRSQEQLRALAARLQAVREEESVRAAREIHDVVGQQLTALNMDLVWLRKRTAKKAKEPDYSSLRQRIESMASLVKSMAKSVQRIASQLRPGVLDDLGLAAALEWQAQEFEKRSGIKCRWKRKARDAALSEGQATAIFRIFQEALSNVARHAHARNVTLDLAQSGAGLVLEIADDGKGFDEKKLFDRKSLGLLGMRERATFIGANVKTSSAPGKGTTVTVALPLPATNTQSKGIPSQRKAQHENSHRR